VINEYLIGKDVNGSGSGLTRCMILSLAEAEENHGVTLLPID
jgi:hypothetical protein